MPRRNGHNRKRYVFTCPRCKQQFRASRPDAKRHPSCKVMDCNDRQKMGIHLKPKPQPPAPPEPPKPFKPTPKQIEGRIKIKLPNGENKTVYPVLDPGHEHIFHNGYYIYTAGEGIYQVTPEQYARIQQVKAAQKPPAPAQPAQPVKAPAWQPTQQQHSKRKLVDLNGKPEYIYPVLNERGQQMLYNNAPVWQDSKGNKIAEPLDLSAAHQAPKKGILGRLLG